MVLPPYDPAPDPCRRSAFLEAMLSDQEHRRLAPLEHYLEQFADISEFVEAEYAAFACVEPARGSGEAESPTVIGRFRLVRRLAEGGMGLVHEALDTVLGRRVVVKRLRADLLHDARAKERLMREAQVLSRLDHPALAKVLDLVEVDGCLHLVMPFHEGETLAEKIREARGRSEAGDDRPSACAALLGREPGSQAAQPALVSFFERCARALQSAHAAGIVHRDLKPQNLMVTPDGSPVVLDFGLALPAEDQRLTAVGELMGTPLYMAPEQVDGEQADIRTDIYALGVCLYEALTLAHPFAGSGGRAAVFQRVLRGDPVAPRRHRSTISRDLEAVVLRAMHRERRMRYADMIAFANDLHRVMNLEPTEARPASSVGVAWRRLWRNPKILLLSVAAIGFAAWGLRSSFELHDIGNTLSNANLTDDEQLTKVRAHFRIEEPKRDAAPRGEETETLVELPEVVGNTLQWRVRREEDSNLANWTFPWHFTVHLEPGDLQAQIADADQDGVYRWSLPPGFLWRRGIEYTLTLRGHIDSPLDPSGQPALPPGFRVDTPDRIPDVTTKYKLTIDEQ